MEARKISLLSGSYSPSQANDMLMNLIKNGLQFNRLQNFTSLIRYEGNCDQASQNIHQLCRASEEIDVLVEKAKAEGLHLHIKASIQLSLVEEVIDERVLAAYPSA